MTIQRALVIGAGGGVGRATAAALRAAGARVVAAGHERDATDPAEVAALLDEADPDLVVVAAGARPRMAAIEDQTWASFSAPWDVDVRIAFEAGRAALARPLRPGSTVVIVSSGAGLHGSPLSGGYSGAKRTQMFVAALPPALGGRPRPRDPLRRARPAPVHRGDADRRRPRRRPTAPRAGSRPRRTWPGASRRRSTPTASRGRSFRSPGARSTVTRRC